jgi:glutaredoxin
MSDYSLKLILLQNCGYSMAANELIQSHKIPSQTHWISQTEKEQYVNDKIQTFPQNISLQGQQQFWFRQHW